MSIFVLQTTLVQTLFNLMPIFIMILIFYFLVLYPASKRQRKLEEMRRNLKKGDKVLTSGGIYGEVKKTEEDVVYLKVADNVTIKVSRTAIVHKLEGGK